MKWFASWSSSAGSARWRSFITRSASWVRSRRSTGSATFVNSGALISMIRLPNVPACSERAHRHRDLGHERLVGSSSCSSSQRRTAPAQIDTTTSLTVQPCRFLTRLTASSESRPKAKRRCGEMRPLKLVRGAFRLVRSSRPPSPRLSAWPTRPATRAASAGARQRAERRLVEVRQRRRQRAQQPQRVARQAQQPAPEHLQLARVAVQAARRAAAGASRPSGRQVEQHAHDLGPREAVHQRVVDLREHRRAVRSEPVDQVHLPERARAVERPRDDARHLLGELLVVARRRERQLAHVEVEVEVGVVDPVRVVEPERHLGEPPAQRRQQRQALGDQVVHRLERQLAVRARGGVEDGQPADVPALARGLERQELGVDARELSHGQFAQAPLALGPALARVLDRRERLLHLLAIALEVRRQREPLAQVLRVLVGGEARARAWRSRTARPTARGSRSSGSRSGRSPG